MRIGIVFLGLCVAAVSGYGQTASPYREIVVTSRELSGPRRMWVKVPPNYSLHERKLPLTIVLDGDDKRLLDLATASARYNSTLDALDPDVPEQIVVGIESQERGSDFGKNEASMMRFLEREVLPALAQRYRIQGPHTIVGHSLGGAFALDMMCKSPGLFRAVVAISPALADTADAGRVTRCLRDLTNHSVFIAVGSRARDGTEDQFRPNILSVIKSLTSPHVRLLELPDASHSRTPLFGIPAGLDYVNTEWARGSVDSVRAALLSGRIDPVVALDSLGVIQNSARAGAVPGRWYHMTSLILNGGGRAQDAMRIVRKGIALYPERIELYEALADACTKTGDTACARSAAQQGIAMIARREDLTPFARDREAAAMRKRWLSKAN